MALRATLDAAAVVGDRRAVEEAYVHRSAGYECTAVYIMCIDSPRRFAMQGNLMEALRMANEGLASARRRGDTQMQLTAAGAAARALLVRSMLYVYAYVFTFSICIGDVARVT